MGVVFVK